MEKKQRYHKPRSRKKKWINKRISIPRRNFLKTLGIVAAVGAVSGGLAAHEIYQKLIISNIEEREPEVPAGYWVSRGNIKYFDHKCRGGETLEDLANMFDVSVEDARRILIFNSLSDGKIPKDIDEIRVPYWLTTDKIKLRTNDEDVTRVEFEMGNTDGLMKNQKVCRGYTVEEILIMDRSVNYYMEMLKANYGPAFLMDIFKVMRSLEDVVKEECEKQDAQFEPLMYKLGLECGGTFDARSPAGCVGVLQPSLDMFKKFGGRYRAGYDGRKDPIENIGVGIKIAKHFAEGELNGEQGFVLPDLTMVAYNQGGTKLRTLLKDFIKKYYMEEYSEFVNSVTNNPSLYRKKGIVITKELMNHFKEKLRYTKVVQDKELVGKYWTSNVGGRGYIEKGIALHRLYNAELASNPELQRIKSWNGQYKSYKVENEKTLQQIAKKKGISLNLLRRCNPQFSTIYTKSGDTYYIPR